MKLSLNDKLTVLFTNPKYKIDLLNDVARSLQQEYSIPAIAKDFQTFGSSFEKLAGRRIAEATLRTKPLYSAFEGLISELSIQTLRSGDNSGDIAQAFKKAATSLETSEGLFYELTISYIIPILKLFGILIATGFIGEQVYSQLESILPKARWPTISIIFYEFSSFFYDYWLIVILALIFTFSAMSFSIRYCTGEPRDLLDKLPFFKQYRILIASQLLNQLSTLLNSGKPLLETVQWLSKKESPYCKSHLKKIERNITEVKRSGNIGHIFNTGLINQREVTRLQRSIPENQLGDYFSNAAENHTIQLKRNVQIFKFVSNFVFLLTAYTILLWFFISVFFLILSVQ